MAAQRRDKAKDFLVDEYIKALSEDRIPWAKGWEENEYGKIRNGISNRPYQRTNALILTYVTMQRGNSDPRWYTYNQAKSKGYQVRRGEKSVPVSFPILFRNNQRISLDEYNQLPEADKKNVYWSFKNYNLFNAEQIDGVPKLEENKTVTRQIEGSKLVEDIRSGMGIRLKHFGDQPHYNPLLDVVVVPDNELFLSEEDYNATVLHELCHGTGHSSRLNRDLGGSFGSEKYAREELRAEIASSFLMQSLQLRMPDAHIDNHKAYIQSWIQVLKKDPDELFKAIADAANIEKYALEKGGIDLDKLMKEKRIIRQRPGKTISNWKCRAFQPDPNP